jgi:Na+/H+ antiporter NhaD/arsenite permease-like protein
LNEFKQAYGVKNKNLLKKSVLILGGVIFLFIIQGSIGIEVSLIAVGGIFLVITRA